MKSEAARVMALIGFLSSDMPGDRASGVPASAGPGRRGPGLSGGRAMVRPVNGFGWSVSRHDSFMTCKRRYFYSYYEAQVDPEVHRLKKLSALPLWAESFLSRCTSGSTWAS